MKTLAAILMIVNEVVARPPVDLLRVHHAALDIVEPAGFGASPGRGDHALAEVCRDDAATGTDALGREEPRLAWPGRQDARPSPSARGAA